MAQNCATDRVLLCFWHCRHEVRAYYDFGEAEDSEWLVDEIIAHQWKGTKVSFLVQWNLGDTTWEPYYPPLYGSNWDLSVTLQSFSGISN